VTFSFYSQWTKYERTTPEERFLSILTNAHFLSESEHVFHIFLRSHCKFNSPFSRFTIKNPNTLYWNTSRRTSRCGESGSTNESGYFSSSVSLANLTRGCILDSQYNSKVWHYLCLGQTDQSASIQPCCTNVWWKSNGSTPTTSFDCLRNYLTTYSIQH